MFFKKIKNQGIQCNCFSDLCLLACSPNKLHINYCFWPYQKKKKGTSNNSHGRKLPFEGQNYRPGINLKSIVRMIFRPLIQISKVMMMDH